MIYTKIIDEIKIQLVENPFDPLHDVCHHYETWKNCRNIVEEERLDLDKISLYLAAWCHDLETYYEHNEHKKLKKILKQNNFETSQINKVIQIIEEHSFSEKQILLESKVLFDADMLEHVSIPRWEYTLQAFKENYFPKKRVDYYENLQNQLLKKVEDRLNFNFSKNKYNELKNQFIKYATDLGIYKDGLIKISNLKHVLIDR